MTASGNTPSAIVEPPPEAVERTLEGTRTSGGGANEPDLAELPAEVRSDMRFVPVNNPDEVLKVALPRPLPS